MRARLQAALLRAWTTRGWLAHSLLAPSLLYRALVALRRLSYRIGWSGTGRVDAMVIVVGNVIAGGAGKTPTVLALVEHLRQGGLRVGIVSGGYGRSTTDCREVESASTPQEVGDEPLLLQRKAQVPVFVASSRHTAAQALLTRYPQTQIIICDDGLQHYRLFRDLEVCVFDDRGCGNGWLLPAGPLREAWPRHALASAGQSDARLLVLHTGAHPAFAGHTAQRLLAPMAIARDGSVVSLDTLRLSGTKPLLALAGIAQPQAFFAMLRAQGLTLASTLALPDHYAFESMNSRICEGFQVLCTEKDAHKVWPLVTDALAVPLQLRIDPAFFTALDKVVGEHLAAKLSSPHGHKTS